MMNNDIAILAQIIERKCVAQQVGSLLTVLHACALMSIFTDLCTLADNRIFDNFVHRMTNDYQMPSIIVSPLSDTVTF